MHGKYSSSITTMTELLFYFFSRAEEEAITPLRVSSPTEDEKCIKQKADCKHNHENNNKKPMVGCCAFELLKTIVTRKPNKLFSCTVKG